MHSLIHSPNDPAEFAFDPKLTSRASALDPKQTLAARGRLAFRQMAAEYEAMANRIEHPIMPNPQPSSRL